MAKSQQQPEIFAEFVVTYLTEIVTMDPRAKHPRQQGLVKYKVYAKHAEDAIARMREAAPLDHPIIEIAGVVATGDDSTMLVLPREWGVVVPGTSKLVMGEH